MGKDLVRELKARLPKMKKADVDRVIRGYLQMDNSLRRYRGDKAQELRTHLLERWPTLITYDTKDTPPEIVAEDKKIEREPLSLTADSIRIVPAEQMFERSAATRATSASFGFGTRAVRVRCGKGRCARSPSTRRRGRHPRSTPPRRAPAADDRCRRRRC